MDHDVEKDYFSNNLINIPKNERKKIKKQKEEYERQLRKKRAEILFKEQQEKKQQRLLKLKEENKLKEESNSKWYLLQLKKKKEDEEMEKEANRELEKREILRNYTYSDIKLQLDLYLDAEDKDFEQYCSGNERDRYDSDDSIVKDEQKTIIVQLPRVFIFYVENGINNIDLNDPNLIIFKYIKKIAEVFAKPSLLYDIIGARIIR